MVKASQTEFAELDENGPRPVAVVFDLDRTVTKRSTFTPSPKPAART